MRRYESVVILEPDLAEDDIRNFADRYSEVIKSYGGEVIKVDDWGIKRLAYLVKRREKGRYLFFDFAGNPALIEELERQFKISEEVMKFLSVKLDSDVDLEAVRAAAQAKAAGEAPPPAAVEEPAAAEGTAAPPPETALEATTEAEVEATTETESVQPETPTEEITASAEKEPAPAEEQTETAEAAPASEPDKEAETK